MKRIGKLVGAAALAAAIGVLGADGAKSATANTTVYTAGATVGAATYAPGLGAGVSTTFSLDTARAGIGGQKACVSVHSTFGADPNCSLAASGNYGAGLGGLGGYCGYSSGKGFVTRALINGNDSLPRDGAGNSLLALEWKQSAGTALPTIYTVNGQTVGFGLSQTTGAAPGTCGVNGGTTSFAVTGFSTLALP